MGSSEQDESTGHFGGEVEIEVKAVRWIGDGRWFDIEVMSASACGGPGEPAGAVVEDGEQDRPDPLAVGVEDLARSMMKVQVPEPTDILRLVASHLPRGVAF